jgi:MFS family permease
MLIAVFIGVLSDRADHWRLAMVGLALMAVSGFAGSFASNGSQLLFSRFLEGIGFLAVVVAAPSLIVQAASGRNRQMALGLWPGYMPCGVSITILMAPLPLAAEGWRGLWIAVAALAAALAALMLFASRTASRPRTEAQGEAVWKSIRVALAQGGPRLVAGCFALYVTQPYAIINWMPTFVIEERSIGPASAASLTALVVAMNGLCNVLGGWLLHRGFAPWAMIFAAGFAMAFSAVATFSLLPDLARYLAAIVLCGAGGLVPARLAKPVPSTACSCRPPISPNSQDRPPSQPAFLAQDAGKAHCG